MAKDDVPVDHWHVISWELDKDRGVYEMVLGRPRIEAVPVTNNRGEPAVDSRNRPLTMKRLVGWENRQTVLFAADAKEYTHHAGRKLKPAKILERQMKAVAEAWSTTIEDGQ